MKKEEYLQLSNEEKIEMLNQYTGKTKEFKEEHDFSWTYATDHCKCAKVDGRYISIENMKSNKNQDREDKDNFIIGMRNKERKKVCVFLLEDLIDKIDQEKKTSVYSKTEIINYILYKYFEETEKESES